MLTTGVDVDALTDPAELVALPDAVVDPVEDDPVLDVAELRGADARVARVVWDPL